MENSVQIFGFVSISTEISFKASFEEVSLYKGIYNWNIENDKHSEIVSGKECNDLSYRNVQSSEGNHEQISWLGHNENNEKGNGEE